MEPKFCEVGLVWAESGVPGPGGRFCPVCRETPTEDVVHHYGTFKMCAHHAKMLYSSMAVAERLASLGEGPSSS